jgi:FixJ family two-component response regulator
VDLQHALNNGGWTQPLIVMTALPTAIVRKQMMTAGARAFLTKPIDPEALLEAVEDAIRLEPSPYQASEKPSRRP